MHILFSFTSLIFLVHNSFAVVDLMPRENELPKRLVELSIFDVNGEVYWTNSLYVYVDTTVEDIFVLINETVPINMPFRLDGCAWLIVVDHLGIITDKQNLPISSHKKIFELDVAKVLVQAHLTEYSKVRTKCSVSPRVKQLRFYWFDAANFSSILLNVYNWSTVDELLNQAETASGMLLDNCVILIGTKNYSVQHFDDLLLTNGSILIYPFLLMNKLFAFGYSRVLQKCEIHRRLCSDECQIINEENWHRKWNAIAPNSIQYSERLFTPKNQSESGLVEYLYQSFDKRIPSTDEVKILELYLVLSSNNSLVKLKNYAITASDNLSTILNLFKQTKPVVDNCTLLWMLANQTTVMENYVVVGPMVMFQPLMTHKRMLAYFFEPKQGVCALYRQKCYEICRFNQVQQTVFPYEALPSRNPVPLHINSASLYSKKFFSPKRTLTNETNVNTGLDYDQLEETIDDVVAEISIKN